MNVIIDYEVGNIFSVQRGLERAGISSVLSSDKEVILKADLLILPGVGAFQDAMDSLEQRQLVDVIKEFVKTGKPMIGICLGMQLLFDYSMEFGKRKGLGLIPGQVLEFDIEEKVPHMGWNDLSIQQDDLIVKRIKTGEFVYFVHSFYAETDAKYIIADTQYGIRVPAIVNKDNVYGMQFHPEKSGDVGLRLMQQFKELIL
jgi:glutamine amidotransferase